MAIELPATVTIEEIWTAITSGRVSYTSFANLQVAVSRPIGSMAEVQGDAGSHEDPVSAAVVDNNGVYRRVAEGWQRIADLPETILTRLMTAGWLIHPQYTDTATGLAATNEGEAFPVDNGDGTLSVYLHDVGGVATELRRLIQDPSAENTLDLFFHKPSFASSFAITRSLRTWLNDKVSLRNFFTYVDSADIADATDTIGQANADNWDDLIHELQTVPYAEPRLDLPGGILPIARMDFKTLATDDVTDTQAVRVALNSLGTVRIVGTHGENEFIFGSSLYEDGKPWAGDPPFVRGIRTQGSRLLIEPRAGEVYTNGARLDAFVDCNLVLGVSGDYGTALADRVAVALDVSFDNVLDLHVGSPGNPGGGFTSYLVNCGANNINKNKFYGRLAGPGYAVADVVGMKLTGNANVVDMDVSALETAIFELAGEGNVIELYAEAIKFGYVAQRGASTGISKGTVMLGGNYDIQQDGRARVLERTHGFVAIGGHRKFTGTGTADIEFGANAYLPHIIGGTYEAGSGPVNVTIGTERLITGGLSEVGSYRPGNQATPFTPVYRDATTVAGPGGAGSPIGFTSTNGKQVRTELWFSIGSEVLGSVREIALPIPVDMDRPHSISYGYEKNPNRYRWKLTDGGGSACFLIPIQPTDGTERTVTQMSLTEFSMIVEYTAQ